MSLKFRKASSEQLPIVKEMIKKYWTEIEEKYPDPSTLELCLENIDHTLAFYYKFFQDDYVLSEVDNFYFIYLGQEIIGCISLEKIEDISELYICDLMIKSESQGLGYGKMTLDFAFEMAKKSSLKQVGLWVDKKNIAAKNLYQKSGFVLVKPEKLDWINAQGKVVLQTDSEYLVKKLT